MSSRSRGSGSKRGNSSVGLLVALGGGGLLIMILIVVLTTGGDTPEPSSYAQYPTSIDTSFGQGAPGFAIGEASAPVTVVDYSDFSCSFCAELAPDIEAIIEEYVPSGQVRVIYKPLAILGPQSVEASKGVYCAGQQGYFWEMHDQTWELYSTSGPNGYTQRSLRQYAETVNGLDVDAWNACYDNPDTTVAINQLEAEAQALGVRGTPTVFLNGEVLQFRSDPGVELRQAVEAALAN